MGLPPVATSNDDVTVAEIDEYGDRVNFLFWRPYISSQYRPKAALGLIMEGVGHCHNNLYTLMQLIMHYRILLMKRKIVKDEGTAEMAMNGMKDFFWNHLNS